MGVKRSLGISLLVVAALGCAVATPPSDEATEQTPPPGQDVEGSIRLSLDYLRRDGDRWLRGKSPIQEGSPCVSCHHVGFTLWSHEEALRAGLEFDEPTQQSVDDIERRTLDFLAQPDRPRVVSVTQMMMADAATPELAELLVETAQPEGHWRARGQFPSQRRGETEGDAANSLWALLALQRSNPQSDTAVARLEAARRWLASAEPGSSLEWFAARHAVDAESASRVELLGQQNEDGGWGWIAGEESNALSTAQALYALSLHPPSEPEDGLAIQRAADWLLDRQGEDGSWRVDSALVSEAPSEAKQEIYQYWSSAWAAIALSRSLKRVALEGRS